LVRVTDSSRTSRHVREAPQPEIALSLYCRLTILPNADRAIRL